MAEGFESYRQDGSIICSTNRNGTLVFIESLTLNPGQSSSRSYPKVASGGLVVQSSASAHTISVGTDSGGNTQLSWTAAPYNAMTLPTDVTVMASKLLETTNGSGIDIRMPTGEVVVSTDYPPPQCVGYTDFNATAQTNLAVADGYTLYTHKSAVAITMGSTASRFVVLGLPDSGANDTWYAVSTSMLKAGQNFYVDLLVFTKSTSYQLPRLFVFAINNPNPSSTAVGCQVFTPDGRLLFDAGAENMALTDAFTVDYLPYGTGTKSYAPNFRSATYVGIVFPGMYWIEEHGATELSGYGAVRMASGQLTFRLMQTASRLPTSDDPAQYGNVTTNLFCAMVDLTYLGYSLGSGAGGGTSQSAPQITTQPSNAYVTAGDVAQFSVGANGSPTPTYQWYRGGTPISGATAATYSFTTSVGDSGASFYCIIKNSFGSVQSNTVYATVTSGSSVTPVHFSASPQSITVVSGNPATFSVAVAGTAPISFQWWRGTVPIDGATSSSYTLICQDPDNGASFHCVATNGNGAYTDTSYSANLTVNPAPVNAPVFTELPSDTTANQGQVIYMRVAAENATDYRWYVNGQYFSNTQSIQLPTGTIGTVSYYCIAYNGQVSRATSTYYMTVIGPSSFPYSRYRDFDGEIDVVDNNVEFSIYNNGSSDTLDWAIGTGDGTLYTVSASGDFIPAYGSFGLNVEYDFAQYSGVSWLAPKPASTRPGVMVRYTLNVSVSIKGGGVVASGAITLISRNPGTIVE